MHQNHKLNLTIRSAIILLLGVSILYLAISIIPNASAKSIALPVQSEQLLAQVSMSNEECLTCHETPQMLLPLPSGEQLYLTVDRVIYNLSVHGRAGYACVQCHTDITEYPHPELDYQNIRDFKVAAAETCGDCHSQEEEIYQQGDHAAALRDGDTNSAVCTDCHGAHEIQEFGSSHSRIALTCRKCHSEIYDVYKDSVHGQALLEDFNPFVPSCVDCHSNHSNAGPEERPEFHLLSVQICAECHADKELMTRYEVNTDVFDTYVADFHGSTITIFEKIAPDQQTNKPVCVDCHGVHDIRSPEDEMSSVVKQNLLTTCQRCHDEATLNFPDAWLSHYQPDFENNTLVFAVDTFYLILIPSTVVGLLLFISSDAWRRFFSKNKDSEQGRKG